MKRFAIQKSEQGVQSVNTARGDVRWDDIRVFLAVARLGSLRGAAAHAGLSVNTVRARMDRLEATLDAILLRRSRDGVTLTDAGRRFVRLARQMHAASDVEDVAGARDVLVAPGELRIACTEGLGSMWLTPRLDTLRTSIPGTLISLQFDYDLENGRMGGADIQLSYAIPTDPDLVVCRLATLHMHMFASLDYVRRHGEPASMDDLGGHRFIEQAAPGYNGTMWRLLTGADPEPGQIAIRTNSSITQFWAAVNGAGIAILPTYARALTSAIVPVGPPMQMRAAVYYIYHASAREAPTVQAALQWLRTTMDPATYPWFADHFVHPADFARAARDSNIVTLFDGMADRIAVPR